MHELLEHIPADDVYSEPDEGGDKVGRVCAEFSTPDYQLNSISRSCRKMLAERKCTSKKSLDELSGEDSDIKMMRLRVEHQMSATEKLETHLAAIINMRFDTTVDAMAVDENVQQFVTDIEAHFEGANNSKVGQEIASEMRSASRAMLEESIKDDTRGHSHEH